MSKPGSAGIASDTNANVDRRERLRQLALQTIDLAKDPYIFKNHLGSYECKLCLTLHNNEGNYLAHTQGKKHQTNLARRAAREAKDSPAAMVPPPSITAKRNMMMMPMMRMPKIGRPGYKVIRQIDPTTGQKSLIFEIKYPEIAEGMQPRHRFMSAYEQKVELPNPKFQYLLFAAQPYETIAFKIPSWEIDRGGAGKDSKIYTNWDRDSLTFTLQFHYKVTGAKREDNEEEEEEEEEQEYTEERHALPTVKEEQY
ncbi:CWF complex protein sap62 [Balamuthia mandrillaris]